VELAATGIPTGGTITVTVSPATGNSVAVTSTPLAGTLAASTATAQINVPNGLSSVQASTNFTVPLALVESLTRYAGETVKNLKLTSVMNGGSKTLAITASGREVEIPAAMLMHVALAPN
jgi:ABC-type arginine/histidine transport system permease subunit